MERAALEEHHEARRVDERAAGNVPHGASDRREHEAEHAEALDQIATRELHGASERWAKLAERARVCSRSTMFCSPRFAKPKNIWRNTGSSPALSSRPR